MNTIILYIYYVLLLCTINYYYLKNTNPNYLKANIVNNLIKC